MNRRLVPNITSFRNTISRVTQQPRRIHHIMSSHSWNRLIRFVDDNGRETFGEPLVSDENELTSLLAKNELWAHEYQGASAIQTSQKGDKVRVKTLLDLFRPEDVPIIRCIGLNYKEHSESNNILTTAVRAARGMGSKHVNDSQGRWQNPSPIPLRVHQTPDLGCRPS